MSNRFERWRNRLGDRLARSSRVFLLGVIVACGIEVINDWSSTLSEINRLRANVRHKGENYVSILGKPSQAAVRARDAEELARVTEGLFDDEDAACIRYYDASGKVIYTHTKPDYEPVMAPHRALYDHLMDRDTAGMLKDSAAYKAHVAGSRYRDFAQVWTDTTAHAVALVAKPPAPASRLELVLYQDRLRDENHKQNNQITWAIGVLRDQTNIAGAVLVAFDMRKTNDAIRAKYLKGLGIIAFFVALIVVQSVLARRDKLRLLDLQTRYGSAKKALRDGMPRAPLESRGVRLAGALDQAKGPVDGMTWSVAESGGRIVCVVVDPDGDGIDAASVGLHMVKTFRAHCESGIGSLDEEVAALGTATSDIPLTRPIGIALVAIDPATGMFEARLTKFASLRMLGGEVPAATESARAATDGIVGPISACSGVLPEKASLLVFCAGLGAKEASLEADALARYLERAHSAGTPLPVDDAATWARGRMPALAENDIAIVAVTRQ